MKADVKQVHQVQDEQVTCLKCRNSRGGRLTGNVRRDVKLLLYT